MADPVITGIISSSILDISNKSAGKVRSHIFNHPKTLNDVEEVFEDSLRDALSEWNEKIEDRPFDKVLKNWDSVIEHLNSTKSVFSKEEEAVTHISEVLLREIDNSREPDEICRVLRIISADAMENAIDELEHQVKKNNMFEEFSIDLDITILQELNSIKQQLNTIANNSRYSQFYTVFDIQNRSEYSEIRGEIADRLNSDIDPQYVSIPERNLIKKRGKYLILGRRGAGKTRLLIETTVELLTSGNARYLIIPHKGFSASTELDSLLAETFDDETLLIWDDIHDITSIENSDPFRETVMKLEEAVSGEVSVLATARSEHYNDLSGVERWQEDQLWSDFKRKDLQSLSKAGVKEVIHELQADGVLHSDPIKQRLVEKILATDPTPFYTVSAVRILKKIQNPSIEDVNKIPKTGIEIWKEQYQILRDTAPAARRILMAINLLDTLSVPLYPELVRVTAEKVFNLETLNFEPTVEDLVERQWLETRNEDSNDAIFVIHGVQVSAIEDISWRYIKNFSSFTLDNLEQHFQRNDSFLANLHYQIAVTTRTTLGTKGAKIAINHFEKAIQLNPELAEARSAYGVAVAKQVNLKDGLEHVLTAAEMAPKNPAVRYNAGVLLIKNGRSEDALPHLKRATKLMPDFSWVHSSFAKACVELDKLELAVEESDKAISIAPSDPHAYFIKAQAHYFNKDIEDVREPAAKARALLYDQGQYVNLLHVLQLLARAATDLENYNDAVDYCEEGFDIVEQLESGEIKRDFRIEDETLDIFEAEDTLRDIYLKTLERSGY